VRELSATLQATAGYYERRGDYAELMAAKSVRHELQIEIPLARRVPLYAASWGKVLLAQFSDPELEDYIARTSFTPFTRATVSSGEALRRQVEVIRREGFAVADREYVSSMVGLAAPLTQQGHPMGAIGVAVTGSRYTPEFDGEARRLLAKTAELFQKMADG
jgi:IclR family pca regulon transcriptional regulator